MAEKQQKKRVVAKVRTGSLRLTDNGKISHRSIITCLDKRYYLEDDRTFDEAMATFAFSIMHILEKMPRVANIRITFDILEQ